MALSGNDFIAHLIIETYLKVILERFQNGEIKEADSDLYNQCFNESVKVILDYTQRENLVMAYNNLLAALKKENSNTSYNPVVAYQFFYKACLRKKIGENKVEKFIKNYNKRKFELNITVIDDFDHEKNYRTILDVTGFYYLKFYVFIRLPLAILDSGYEFVNAASFVGPNSYPSYNFYVILMAAFIICFIILLWDTIFVKSRLKLTFRVKWGFTILYWIAYSLLANDFYNWFIYTILDFIAISEYLHYFKLTQQK